MKPTQMPASRLTAGCIWNSFRSSGKRHLLLISNRREDKDALLSQLFPDPLPGLTTRTVPGETVYLKENTTGTEVRIGAADPRKPDGEMEPVFFGFALLGIPALRRCAQSDSEWFSINEIAYMVLTCQEFNEEIRKLMEEKRMIAAIRRKDLPKFYKLIHRPDVFQIDLDDPFGNIVCVIMASGEGKRFGGNKLMASFRGQPMILRILQATEGVFARRVVVTRHSDVAELCRSIGVDVVLHDLPGRNDTVRLGLDAVGDISGCMFCPADQPLLTAETVKALVLSGRNVPDVIWRTASGGDPGAPILFPKWAFRELRELPAGKGGGMVAANHPDRVKLLEAAGRFELADVDTREMLFQLEQSDA